MKKHLLTFFLIPLLFFSQDREKDSLLNIVRTTKNDSLKIEAYNKLFFTEVYSDPSAAKKYYEILFLIGKKKPYAKARANNLKGIYLDVGGNYDSAYVYYKKAVQLSVGKYPNVEGSAYNNIGLIYWNRGSYTEALKYYGRALKLFEKINNKLLQANVLSNIGLIYYDINNAKKSEFYQQQSLKIREEINDEYGISVSLVNIGNTYQKQGKFRSSISLYEKSIRLKYKLEDEIGLTNAFYNLANSYFQLKEFDKAIPILKKGENLCLKNDSEANNLANIYTCLGDIYVEKKQAAELENLLPKLKLLLDKNKDERNLASYYGLQADYNIFKNNYKNAYNFQKKSDSVDGVLESLEVKKAISLYEAQYQTEKKEKELANTNYKLLKERAESRKKGIFLILSIIILGFGSMIAFLIYRTLKIKNKQQEQEYELKTAISRIETQNKLQEQRLGISRDLHDNIGAQLTFIISSIEMLKQAFHIDDDKINKRLASISAFTKDTITELRDTIWAMNHSEIDFNEIRSRIMNFVEKAQQSNEQIRIIFERDENLDNIKFSSVEGMNILRITQESVNNAMKYSGAKNIFLNAGKTSETITIIIKDDGKGFDINYTKPGNGVRNMQKRAAEMNAELITNSSVGNGTEITLIIPKM